MHQTRPQLQTIYCKSFSARLLLSEEKRHEKHLYITFGRDFSKNNFAIYRNQDVRSSNEDESNKLVRNLFNSIYRFNSERFNVGECAFGHLEVLQPNAANLPEVLSSLRNKTYSFKEYLDSVQYVLPEVEDITVRNLPNNRLRIDVWFHDPRLTRDDLALPLNLCGTGVSQVLSILYVVHTGYSNAPVLIDEPQSFLHPGALKKLIEICQQRSDRQFVVTTHAPSVISAAVRPSILKIAIEKGLSTIVQIDSTAREEMSALIQSVGASLSDVFGSDNILWVEGSTEQLCFPKIIDHFKISRTRGTNILAIIDTGSLDSKRSSLALSIYKKLSESSYLIPPALGFVLDREKKTDVQIADIERSSKGLVTVIGRRTYENYLLDASAITSVLAEESKKYKFDLPKEKIESTVNRYLPFEKRSDEHGWMKTADAPSILNTIFTEASEEKLPYRKTTHSPMLTDYLLQNNASALNEIAEILRNKFKK